MDKCDLYETLIYWIHPVQYNNIIIIIIMHLPAAGALHRNVVIIIVISSRVRDNNMIYSINLEQMGYTLLSNAVRTANGHHIHCYPRVGRAGVREAFDNV